MWCVELEESDASSVISPLYVTWPFCLEALRVFFILEI